MGARSQNGGSKAPNGAYIVLSLTVNELIVPDARLQQILTKLLRTSVTIVQELMSSIRFNPTSQLVALFHSPVSIAAVNMVDQTPKLGELMATKFWGNIPPKKSPLKRRMRSGTSYHFVGHVVLRPTVLTA